MGMQIKNFNAPYLNLLIQTGVRIDQLIKKAPCTAGGFTK